jgi:hypothetical protein
MIMKNGMRNQALGTDPQLMRLKIKPTALMLRPNDIITGNSLPSFSLIIQAYGRGKLYEILNSSKTENDLVFLF